MHVPFTHFDISLEVSRVLVQLVDSYNLPVICLHNTPAQYVKLPTYSGPSKDVEGTKRETRERDSQLTVHPLQICVHRVPSDR